MRSRQLAESSCASHSAPALRDDATDGLRPSLVSNTKMRHSRVKNAELATCHQRSTRRQGPQVIELIMSTTRRRRKPGCMWDRWTRCVLSKQRATQAPPSELWGPRPLLCGVLVPYQDAAGIRRHERASRDVDPWGQALRSSQSRERFIKIVGSLEVPQTWRRSPSSVTHQSAFLHTFLSRRCQSISCTPHNLLNTFNNSKKHMPSHNLTRQRATTPWGI